MKFIYILLLTITVAISQNLYAQQITISGYIEDSKTGEKLINANVYNTSTLKGSVTNYYGFYSITIPVGDINLAFSFVGYETLEQSFTLNKDTTINITLTPNINIEEVKVVGNKHTESVRSTRMGVSKLPVSTIKKLPVFMGEVDILKTIQLLPGVQSGSEGTSGIYVRGGSPDQNLILLDGVPVYNVSHLFGFFSVFNADALHSVELTKGGFPARYGGRLSSVLDIRMKEGNLKEFKGEGSIGLISSKLTLEGPIVKDKSSFIISGRRTYIDQIVKLLQKIRGKELTAGYYFYDLNAKINYKINNKHHLYLSTYLGDDVFYNRDNDYDDKNEAEIKWGNITTALRWNYAISNKLFSNATITYSKYNFGISVLNESSDATYGGNYDSGINDIAFKINHDYIPNTNHYIRYGASITRHTFNPGITTYEEKEGGIETYNKFGDKKLNSLESNIFIEDDYEISSRLKMNFGLHFSSFNYDSSNYYSLEPRLSARYLINNELSIKAAYTKMSQNIHLLTNSGISLPTDLWLPVTEKVKPQKSDQYAIGLTYQPSKNYSFKVESFYKSMDNLIAYKEGASFFDGGTDWQEKIESGKGLSYGLEFHLEKKTGKTTGWIGYTLSKTTRQFDNISFGKTYPFKYDRKHDISIAVTHKFNDKWDVGLTWVYGTGKAVTIPIQTYDSHYEFGSGTIEHIEKRNNYREPAYHRMDIGFNRHKTKRWGRATLHIGVYNVYNRKNPYFLHFDYFNSNDVPQKQLKQVSLFPIMPSISYRFEF